MLEKLKVFIGLGWVEFTTTLAFLAVGISLIYKYMLFSDLGIPWYINNSSAFSIFTSSIQLFISLISGLVAGIFTISNLDKIRNNFIKILLIGVFAVLALSYVAIGEMSYFSPHQSDYFKVNMPALSLIALGFLVSFLFYYTVGVINHSRGYGLTKYKLIQVTSFITIVICFAMMHGKREAKNVIENRDLILNVIELKESKDGSEIWYLLDYMNEKALIINNSKSPSFKIVEYKDLEIIKPIKR